MSGGGGGTQQSLYGEPPPCLTLFCTILTEKVPLSYIPSTYKWYSFNIPSLELCIPVDCCKSAHCLNMNI